jgi:hypothetical protein
MVQMYVDGTMSRSSRDNQSAGSAWSVQHKTASSSNETLSVRTSTCRYMDVFRWPQLQEVQAFFRCAKT